MSKDVKQFILYYILLVILFVVGVPILYQIIKHGGNLLGTVWKYLGMFN